MDTKIFFILLMRSSATNVWYDYYYVRTNDEMSMID